MFYKDFYPREMWYLNTRKNTIFLHVKILIISLTSGLSLKLYLNSLVYHRNIFGSSSKVPGNLRKSSDIFGNFQKYFLRKCSGTFIWSSGQFEKSSENHQKRRSRQERYLTHSLRSLVRYCSCHSNIKFISSRHRVIFSI